MNREELIEKAAKIVAVGDGAQGYIPSQADYETAKRVLAVFEQAHTPTTQIDAEPHSRACGARRHDHGVMCSPDCPTCHGEWWTIHHPETPSEPTDAEINSVAEAIKPILLDMNWQARMEEEPGTLTEWAVKITSAALRAATTQEGENQ